MDPREEEETLLRSVALQNAQSTLQARERAEEELHEAKDALELRSEELAHSLAMLRATLESTADSILVTDDTGQVTGFNEKFVTLWQLSGGVMESRDHRQILASMARFFKDPEDFLARVEGIHADSPPESHDLLELLDGRTIERFSRILYVDQRTVGRVWSFRDITERRLVEAAHRKQSEWLRVTLASIGDAVITTDTEERVLSLNSAAERLTGWTQEEAEGRALGEVFWIVNEATRETIENRALQALLAGSVDVGLPNQTILIARDGTEIPIDDSAAPLHDESGRVRGVVLIFRSVAERKAADEDRARLASIVDSSDDAIVSKSLDGIIRSWNAAAERIFGFTAAQAIGMPITLIIPPELAEEERQILARIRRGERVDHFDTRRVRSDGTLIPISLTISPIRDPAGVIVGASKIARDITERTTAEARLRESEARFRLLADAAPVLIWLAAPDQRRTWFNRKWLEFVGRSMAEEMGTGWTDNVHRDDLSRCLQTYTSSFAARQAYSMEYRMHRQDRGYRWLLDTGVPLYGASGEFTGYIGSCVDITEQKDASDRKDEFLATLSHELRNPLAPIRNAVQILKVQGGSDPELQRWSQEVIDRQVQQMARLLEDLLDVSRISHRKLELRRERIELGAVVQAAIETSRPLIDSGGHRLIVHLPAEPVYLNADAVRLAQVFSNLLNNAAKYAEAESHIVLRVHQDGAGVVVSVKDEGIGISREMLPHIFEMFSQSKDATARSQGGLGIGLSLARGLVESHGGTIEAKSEGRGKGSEFIVRLPPSGGATLQSAGPEQPPVEGDRSYRLLVVDDLRDNADSLAALLKVMGHEVATAYDGEGAIRMAAEFMPEIILLDIGMPQMNGLDACRFIRTQSWGQDMLLVATTGWGQENDRRRTEEAGFDHHLVKPVHPEALTALLASLSDPLRSTPKP